MTEKSISKFSRLNNNLDQHNTIRRKSNNISISNKLGAPCHFDQIERAVPVFVITDLAGKILVSNSWIPGDKTKEVNNIINTKLVDTTELNQDISNLQIYLSAKIDYAVEVDTAFERLGLRIFDDSATRNKVVATLEKYDLQAEVTKVSGENKLTQNDRSIEIKLAELISKRDKITPSNDGAPFNENVLWYVTGVKTTVTRFFSSSTATIILSCAVEDQFQYTPPIPSFIRPEMDICIWGGYIESYRPVTQDDLTKGLLRAFVGIIDTVQDTSTNTGGYTLTVSIRDRMKWLMDTSNTFEIQSTVGQSIDRSDLILNIAQRGIGFVPTVIQPIEAPVRGGQIVPTSPDQNVGTEKAFRKILADPRTQYNYDVAKLYKNKQVASATAIPSFEDAYRTNLSDYTKSGPLAGNIYCSLGVELNPTFCIYTSRIGVSTQNTAQLLIKQQHPVDMLKTLSMQEVYPTDVFQSHVDGNFYYYPHSVDYLSLSDPKRYFRTYYFRVVPDVVDIQLSQLNTYELTDDIVKDSKSILGQFTADNILFDKAYGYKPVDQLVKETEVPLTNDVDPVTNQLTPAQKAKLTPGLTENEFTSDSSIRIIVDEILSDKTKTVMQDIAFVSKSNEIKFPDYLNSNKELDKLDEFVIRVYITDINNDQAIEPIYTIGGGTQTNQTNRVKLNFIKTEQGVSAFVVLPLAPLKTASFKNKILTYYVQRQPKISDWNTTEDFNLFSTLGTWLVNRNQALPDDQKDESSFPDQLTKYVLTGRFFFRGDGDSTPAIVVKDAIPMFPVHNNQMILSLRYEQSSIGVFTNFILYKSSTSDQTVTTEWTMHLEVVPENYRLPSNTAGQPGDMMPIAKKFVRIEEPTVQTPAEGAAVLLNAARVYSRSLQVASIIVQGDISLTPGEAVQIIGASSLPIGGVADFIQDRISFILMKNLSIQNFRDLAIQTYVAGDVLNQSATDANRIDESVLTAPGTTAAGVNLDDPKKLAKFRLPNNLACTAFIRKEQPNDPNKGAMLNSDFLLQNPTCQVPEADKTTIKEPKTCFRVEAVSHKFNVGGSKGFITEVSLTTAF